MTRDEMIDKVRTALRALERMPADAEIITVNIAEYSYSYIHTFGCIQKIADALGTSPERRVDFGSPNEVITLESGMEIIEFCRPEGEP